MPTKDKFKRLPWEQWETLIDQLAAEAAEQVQNGDCKYPAAVREAAIRLENRTPEEYNRTLCRRIMRIAVSRNLDGEEFRWTPEN